MTEFTQGPYTVEHDQSSQGTLLVITSGVAGVSLAHVLIDDDIQTADDPDGYTVVRHATEIADAHLLAAAWQMRAFIALIADMKTGSEFEAGGGCMDAEDAVHIVDNLIKEAREMIVGMVASINKFTQADEKMRSLRR